ncbi:hypothetical protein BH09MYX1_BH09MYX1_46140 [soil metagenome]
MASIRPVPNESKIPVGTLLAGKYKVTREIGRGGMAAVYEAEQMALGKKVAIKVLASELAGSNIVIERFFREARAAASVRSPYIVDVYDSGRLEDGRPFITMEMLEGESLYDRMARVRLIDPATTIRIISHCAKGLMKAHSAGIVHRDLKPENIFLTRGDDGADETAKLLDFGLAKFYSPVATDAKTARLTREGAVFGTPAYMSPEQVKGQGNVDHRADLWALGCMAFECLIGRPVWNTEQGVAMTFAAIATQPIPVPSEIRRDLPKSFDAWFAKALQRDPDDRYQSAKELSDALAKSFGESNSPVSYVNLADLEEIEVETMPPPNVTPPPQEKPVLALQQSIASSSELTPPPAPPTPTPRPSGDPLLSTSGERLEKKPSALRFIFSSILVVGGGIASFWVWDTQLKPQVLAPLVVSTASTKAVPTASASSAPATDVPKWDAPLGEAQALFASGDTAGSLKKLKEVAEMGAPSVAKAFSDQMRAGIAGTGECKMVAFSQPRLNVQSNVGRPAVSMSLKAPIVVWTDDHEQPGHDQVYSVLLDDNGHPASAPRSVSPEAAEAWRPALLASGERTALLYWDKSGRDAGVRVRWLDGDGRIAGGSTLIGGGRGGMFWPSIEKTPEGFVVVWQDDRDKEGDDLFLRKLNQELEPIGPELRLTDYVPGTTTGGKVVNVRVPTVAVASNALFITYKLERDSSHLVQRMRIPLDSAEIDKGLEEIPIGSGRLKKDRELGDTKLVNEDRLPADAPSIACGTEGCFIAWHGEKSGVYVALMEPAQGKVLWRRNFAPLGAKPALGVAADGSVMAAYYEKGTIRVASITRDRIGTPSVFAKTTMEVTRPWITPGKAKGEWYVAWSDMEGNHTEAFVAKLQCP